MANDHRCYTDEEGIEWPRLGAILGILDKPQLVDWAAGRGATAAIKAIEAGADPVTALQTARSTWRETSSEAMDIGSEVHEMISLHIQHAIDHAFIDFTGKYRDEVTAGYLAFLEWERGNVTRWIATEEVVIDKIMGFGCTIDAVAELKDGRTIMIDFKTSAAIYDEYKIQVVAGSKAWDNKRGDCNGGIHLDGCGLLRLDKKTGIPEWKEVDDCERWAQVFNTMTTLYYQLKKRRLAGNPFVEKYYPAKPKKVTTKKGRV